MIRMLLGAVVSTGLVLSASAALAQAISNAPVVVTDPDKIECHHDPITGSRLPGPTICKPRRDWAQLSSDGKGLTDAIKDHMEGTPPK